MITRIERPFQSVGGPLPVLACMGVAFVLGVAITGRPPGFIGQLVVAALVSGPIAVDILLLPDRRAVVGLVGTCTLSAGLASSTLPVIPGLLEIGRFAAPALALAVVLRSGLGPRRGLSTRARNLVAALIAGVIVSVTTSRAPANSALKATSLSLMLIAIVAVVEWARTRGASFKNATVWTLTGLCLSNLPWFAVGGTSYSGTRFQGWTINPNTLGVLCGLTLPPLAAAIATSSGSRRHRYVVAFVIVSIELLLSGSRGGTLAAAVGTVAVLRSAQVSRRVTFPIFALALVLAAPAAVRAASQADLLSRVDRPGDSGRGSVWSVAIDEIQRRPLTGAGLATTEDRFAVKEFGKFDVFQGGHFHSSYLEAAVELGLVGAMPLLVVAAFGISHLWRRVPPDALWAAGVAVSGAVVGLFETGLLTAGSAVFFPFWLAVLTLRQQRAGRIGMSPLVASEIPSR